MKSVMVGDAAASLPVSGLKRYLDHLLPGRYGRFCSIQRSICEVFGFRIRLRLCGIETIEAKKTVYPGKIDSPDALLNERHQGDILFIISFFAHPHVQGEGRR